MTKTWFGKPASDLRDVDLLDYSSEHLAYEARLYVAALRLYDRANALDPAGPLVSVAARLATSAQLPENWALWATAMSQLETALIHARNLIEFLYPKWDLEGKSRRTGDTDIIAADFFAPGTWPGSIRPTWTPELNQLKERTSREVGHLTTWRISGVPPTKGHPYASFDALWQAFRSFAAAADPSRLHENVRDVARDLPSVLP